MKRFKKLIALLFIFAVFGIGGPILAEEEVRAASPDATTFCTKKYPENSQGAINARESCKSAYDKAYKSGVKSVNCSDSKAKTACGVGAKAGAAAFTSTVKKTGKAGADAGTKQSKTCEKYNVSTNKKTCEKAWSAQAIVKAKAIGKTATSEDACKNLLGGSKAVNACKSAYEAAKNAAAIKAKEDCGTGDDKVSTYFKLCGSDSDVNKGGRENPIVSLLLTALSWATGLVALATVGAIVYGGILYTTAQDNAAQTQKGIMYVVDSVIGLILWLSAYVLINFIVPGGLF